ncbi:hypothetical protein [Massilia sp. TN1-12]|uniref:hypothetical protein n=1 Tax=Massilia paldalensis TaxID=3377675 RepID=UPI00384F93CE
MQLRQHHKDQDDQVWSIDGVFTHAIYSPMGGIEGMMIDADGIPAQFVFHHGNDDASSVEHLWPGRRVTIEGSEARPWPEGDGAHAVYRFKRLALIEGGAVHDVRKPGRVEGKVVRLNYARHGQANGVVLDTGDFVHVPPDRFAALDIALGTHVQASGPGRPLADGSGRVIDAVELNGKPLNNKAH